MERYEHPKLDVDDRNIATEIWHGLRANRSCGNLTNTQPQALALRYIRLVTPVPIVVNNYPTSKFVVSSY